MKRSPRIMHFPGHGGQGDTRHEKGYISPDGSFVERQWVLDLAYDIHVTCDRWGVDSAMGRTDDTCLSFRERSDIAIKHGANFVIEHHVNAHKDHEIDGLMCFCRAHDNVGMEVCEAIARAAPKLLLRRKSRAYLTSEHDWTKDAHACLRKHMCSAILIEWGFATSTRDLAILTSPHSRPALVAAFMAGVGRLFEVL